MDLFISFIALISVITLSLTWGSFVAFGHLILLEGLTGLAAIAIRIVLIAIGMIILSAGLSQNVSDSVILNAGLITFGGTIVVIWIYLFNRW